MVRKIIQGFFNTMLKIIMSLVQIICLPLNALFEGLFPDFTEHIQTINSGIDFLFNSIGWGINIIPPIVRGTLLFIFTIELSMLVVMRSSHLTAKVWNLLQKIKFW